ncbi:hypothetical protein LJR225_000212 [Phenylobacterium sp. LjRoot225]|uniref:hypothetical protein n=1 Tax=Phenylobacterium sp. LjRoot225 TaxID=3342285 RepID=UPI003ECD79B3
MTYPALQRPPKTHVAPIDHALKASMLQVDQVQRLTHVAAAVTRLAASGAYGSVWEGCWDIGAAATHRLHRLQSGWVQSWFSWLHYCGQIDGASTLSKFSEREINIVNQAQQLISEQSVDLLALLENVQVDIQHWLDKQPGTPPLPTTLQVKIESSPPAKAAVTA